MKWKLQWKTSTKGQSLPGVFENDKLGHRPAPIKNKIAMAKF